MLDLSSCNISDISPLGGLTNLLFLSLNSCNISDISPLTSLTNLADLSLWFNQISDISPLLDNLGLGEGDCIDLSFNPLSEQSVNEYIPELEARGAHVIYES